MNISQIAKKTGLSSKQIRDYEKSGLLPPAKRNAAGYRIYTESDSTRLIFIRNARLVDFSLTEIKQLLQLHDNPQRSSREVKAITEEHINQLKNQIQRLQKMLDLLQSWNNQCCGDENPNCSILTGLTSSTH